MTPAEYLERCRLVLITSAIVKTYHIRESFADERKGYIRVIAELLNGDFLELAEYFVIDAGGILIQDYHYQWMDEKRKTLRRRWDNTPHFPSLHGFPHHIHVENDANVISGEPMSLEKLLAQIASLIDTQKS